MIKRLCFLYALFLVMVIIIADSGQASFLFSTIAAIPMGDKLGHFFLMGMMSFLLTLATGSQRITLGKVSLSKGIFWLAIAVTVEEVSQIWLSTRGFSLVDLAFDFLGIIVFAYLAARLQSSHDYAPLL